MEEYDDTGFTIYCYQYCKQGHAYMYATSVPKHFSQEQWDCFIYWFADILNQKELNPVIRVKEARWKARRLHSEGIVEFRKYWDETQV